MSAIGIMNFVAHDYERVWVDEVGVWWLGLMFGRWVSALAKTHSMSGQRACMYVLKVFSDEQTAYDDAVYTVMGKRR
jgi:hypothetical protein